MRAARGTGTTPSSSCWPARTTCRARTCSTWSRSWTACARRAVARGTRSRPTSRWCATSSRRRTSWSRRSRAAIVITSARSSVTCFCRWCSTPGWPSEDPDDPFDVDDIADGIVTKLVSRHPHVFGDADAATAEHVEANWDRIKAAEKGRTSVLDGIPPGLPALALAEKLLGRVRAPVSTLRSQRPRRQTPRRSRRHPARPGRARPPAGLDAEAELRHAVRRHSDRTRAAETATS